MPTKNKDKCFAYVVEKGNLNGNFIYYIAEKHIKECNEIAYLKISVTFKTPCFTGNTKCMGIGFQLEQCQIPQP